MEVKNLSDRAERWLRSQHNADKTIRGLIELAANPKLYLSLKIARTLDIPHPDRVPSAMGAPEKVSDEALICLRSDGLTYVKISERLGLSPGQVGNRLRKIERERTT